MLIAMTHVTIACTFSKFFRSLCLPDSVEVVIELAVSALLKRLGSEEKKEVST